ncbi:ankyrin-3-like [Anoplophora glabripennis]|uniref:ankyrin-3-like n=1 Tax=Anoplophora glabripennis TaxID=217634 RepID=UPI0008736B53|nr:ankyrin-3-like [Anoplophora glabripennis]
MEMKTTYYFYDDKFWIPVPTGSDNNSFYHSIYGKRNNESEPYIDQYAADKRTNWSHCLTSLKNKSSTMIPGLIDILRRCFSAYEKYKHSSVEDEAQLAQYASDIEAAQEPVKIEEVTFLATFVNMKIVLLSKNGTNRIVEPDHEIIESTSITRFSNYFQRLKIEEVLSLDGNIFSKVVIADENFIRKEQVEYLEAYWIRSLNLEDSVRNKCERYAKALLNKMSSWIEVCHHLKNRLTNIYPQMMAEIFQENNLQSERSEWNGCKEFVSVDGDEPNLPEKMSLIKFYDLFIEKKRNIFVNTENVNGENYAQFEECLASHRILALEAVLDKAKCELFTCYQRESENFEAKLLKFGIVKKSDDKFHFTHDTFQEYFFAESILKELRLQNQGADFQKFLFEEIFSSTEYAATRAFIDSRLRTTTDSLPSNIFQNYQSLKYDVDFKKHHLQCTIHLLAKEGCLGILQLLLKCINFRPVRGKKIEIIHNATELDKDTREHIFGNSLNVLRYLTRHGGVNIKDKQENMPLHYAAEKGHFDTVKFLLEQGANINGPGSRRQTPLHFAAFGGRLNIVKFLVESNANTDSRAWDGTALHLAISGDHFDIVKYLAENSGKNMITNGRYETILDLAAREGRLDFVRLLVEHGDDGDNVRALHLALYGNHMDVVEYLVDRGVDINTKCCSSLSYTDGQRFTTLHVAVSKGNLEALKFLLQRGANAKVKCGKDNTPLHLAVSYGDNVEIVKCLVEFGADLNATDENGCTALYLAVERCRTNTVKYLLQRGANRNITDNEGYSALHIAARENYLDSVKLLVEAAADVNATDYYGKTALHFAVSGDTSNLDIVKCLVENEANVIIRDSEGNTPLHLAVDEDVNENNPDIVRVLAKCGGINIRNFSGETALHLAAYNDLDAVKVLVQEGADINILDFKNHTPLHIAVSQDSLNIVEFLLQNGAHADFKDEHGCSTALHFAALRCGLETFKFFLEREPGFNITGSDGTTVLLLAAERDLLDIFRFIIERGADINGTQEGRTALHVAAKGYKVENVEFLVEAGMDVNARDKQGRTPLHFAAGHGWAPVVKFFIGRVEDVNVRDSQGRTPIHSATLRDRLDAVKDLVEAGADVTICDNDGFTALNFAKLWLPLSTNLAWYLESQNKGQKRRLSY